MISVRQAIENRALKQGVQQGIEQGVTKTAQNMLADKEPIEKIKKWTGLSDKELNILHSQIKNKS